VACPAEEQNLALPVNRRIAAPRPGPATQPPLLVDSREHLVYLITQACELEQGVLCEYLFALYSLKRDPHDGLGGQQFAQVARWGRTLSKVAIQEMRHLALATNLLTALGAVPHLHRPNFPIRCRWYPPDVRLALVPFGEAALRHFMYLERPDSIDLQDAEAFAAICECRPLTATPATLMAGPRDYHTVGCCRPGCWPSTVTVPPGSVPLPLYDRYGLGLLEVETPAGRLVGNAGGIPGFLSIVLSTPDGRRQLGIMINVLPAPDPVYEAFTQVFRELGARLLS
jgi:ferritin-like protein